MGKVKSRKPVEIMMAANFQANPSQSINPSHSLQEDNKADISDKQTLLAVLQFLKKNNLKVCSVAFIKNF